MCLHQTKHKAGIIQRGAGKYNIYLSKEDNYQNWENHFVAPHCHVSLNCHLYDDSYQLAWPKPQLASPIELHLIPS